jgi:hypothetical protein
MARLNRYQRNCSGDASITRAKPRIVEDDNETGPLCNRDNLDHDLRLRRLLQFQ